MHTLYVVHHGNRESVEVFELDARQKQPAVTWIGCAVAPDPIGLNAVVALPEGGFAASNFDPRPPAGARGGFSPALLEGRPNGELWEWHTGRGWAKVPGSEAAGANGLEISKDGKWYYVAEWGNRSFMRLSRGQTPARRDEISLGFRVDNVRWAPDGSLFVAGQGGADVGRGSGAGGAPPVITSVVGKVDPKTMKYQEIANYPTSGTVSFATVAVQVGDELWVGSAFGDRVARYPMKATKGKRQKLEGKRKVTKAFCLLPFALDFLDRNHAGAVAELLGRDAELVEHRQQQVRHRRVRRVPDVTPAFQRARCAAGQDDRQRIVIVLVAVAHARCRTAPSNDPATCRRRPAWPAACRAGMSSRPT